jgi:hypothetical protein
MAQCCANIVDVAFRMRWTFRRRGVYYIDIHWMRRHGACRYWRRRRNTMQQWSSASSCRFATMNSLDECRQRPIVVTTQSTSQKVAHHYGEYDTAQWISRCDHNHSQSLQSLPKTHSRLCMRKEAEVRQSQVMSLQTAEYSNACL